MKINSEKLWKYINEELGTYDKVKFNVYYDDDYVTQIYWNGENFEWESGRFTSEAFFNPLYDFEVIEGEKIPEKLGTYTITDETISGMRKSLNTMINIDIIGTINEIIDYLKNKGE